MMSLSNFAEEKPKGFEQFSEVVGDSGSATVVLPDPNAPHRDLLEAAKFDADNWSIVGPVGVRNWQTTSGEWRHAYSFKTAKGAETPESVEADIEDILKLIKSKKKVLPKNIDGDDAFLYILSDTQLGKAEGQGNGTKETVERILDSIVQMETRVKELRKSGKKLPMGILAGTGDIVEGCTGFYSGQEFIIDMNRRDQLKTARFVLYKLIDKMLDLFEKVVVVAIGGNHGENRKDGKKATDDADNDDVAVFESVREAYDRANESRIEWIIPQSELSLNISVAGIDIGLTHGHLFSGAGKYPTRAAMEWWRNQDFGFQPVRNSKILISSHFHHFSAYTPGSRTHFQTPANDCGSNWFRNSSGSDAPAGVLTMRITSDNSLGWDDLKILSFNGK